jgi:hypothetical protein
MAVLRTSPGTKASRGRLRRPRRAWVGSIGAQGDDRHGGEINWKWWSKEGELGRRAPMAAVTDKGRERRWR